MTELHKDTNQPEETVSADVPKKGTSVVKSPSGDKFVHWTESQLSASLGKVGPDQVVIKKKRVIPGSTHIISSPADFGTKPKTLKVTPIEQDGKIIGLSLQCECGATHEVNFEFDQD